jgi:hypothetical protein
MIHFEETGNREPKNVSELKVLPKAKVDFLAIGSIIIGTFIIGIIMVAISMALSTIAFGNHDPAGVNVFMTSILSGALAMVAYIQIYKTA